MKFSDVWFGWLHFDWHDLRRHVRLTFLIVNLVNRVMTTLLHEFDFFKSYRACKSFSWGNNFMYKLRFKINIQFIISTAVTEKKMKHFSFFMFSKNKKQKQTNRKWM